MENFIEREYLWGETLAGILGDTHFLTVNDNGDHLTLQAWEAVKPAERVVFRRAAKWDLEPAKLASAVQLVTDALGRPVAVYEVSEN